MKIIFRPLFIECFVNSKPLITTRRLVNQSINNHHLSFSHTSSRMYTIVLHSSNVLSIAHSNRFHKWNEWEKNVFFFLEKNCCSDCSIVHRCGNVDDIFFLIGIFSGSIFIPENHAWFVEWIMRWVSKILWCDVKVINDHEM